MSVPFGGLPNAVQAACIQLRDQLRGTLGGNLLALWVHGAVTFADRPRRLGDVDTHAVLRLPVDGGTARAIDRIHETTARDAGLEWDSWYVLERDMASALPPPHAFREHLVDHAWALHRAHWLAGRFVGLHGRAPSELVQPPTWAELADGLRGELSFVERLLAQGLPDAGQAAFVVLNGCRLLYSLRTREVVVSKGAAGRWALDHLPEAWRAAIAAAQRAYEARPEPGDAATLQSAAAQVVGAVRRELA